MSLTRIILVRHGATEWSASGRHTGRTDLPLNEEGKAQATALSTRLSGDAISMAFSSPLVRATETCLLAGLGVPIMIEELAEWDYGDYEGLTTAAIHADRPGWDLFRDGCPNGESAGDVGRRVDEALRRIQSLAHDEEAAGVFAHGHVLRVLAIRWLGLGPHEGRHLTLDTASRSALAYEHENRVILNWNT